MKRNRFTVFFSIFAALFVGVATLSMPRQVWAGSEAQGQSGIYVTITYSDPINVRGGPSTVYYPVVGRVFPGDVIPALGVSPGREWVQIAYPQAPGGVGWVYATYVAVSGGDLQIVEPPPTQTPIATATINPTFAAAFIFQPTNTRLPTFTPAVPVNTPEFGDEQPGRSSGLPFGIIVLIFFVLSGLVYLGSILANR